MYQPSRLHRHSGFYQACRWHLPSVLGRGGLYIVAWIVAFFLYGWVLENIMPSLFATMGMFALHLFAASLLAIYGYLGAWMGGIGIATVRGAKHMRGLPRLNQFGSDVALPMSAFFGTWIVCMLPYIILNLGDAPFPSELGFLSFAFNLIVFKWGAQIEPVLVHSALDWVLVIGGQVTLVVALPLVYATGIGGLHPKRLITAVSRNAADYIVAITVVIALFLGIGPSNEFLHRG